VYEQAVICFAEPRDPETLQERALFDASIETWTASRPDGARQVVAILVKGPWAQMTAQWSWTFGDDPGNADPGSALLLPTPGSSGAGQGARGITHSEAAMAAAHSDGHGDGWWPSQHGDHGSPGPPASV